MTNEERLKEIAEQLRQRPNVSDLLYLASEIERIANANGEQLYSHIKRGQL